MTFCYFVFGLVSTLVFILLTVYPRRKSFLSPFSMWGSRLVCQNNHIYTFHCESFSVSTVTDKYNYGFSAFSQFWQWSLFQCNRLHRVSLLLSVLQFSIYIRILCDSRTSVSPLWTAYPCRLSENEIHIHEGFLFIHLMRNRCVED